VRTVPATSGAHVVAPTTCAPKAVVKAAPCNTTTVGSVSTLPAYGAYGGWGHGYGLGYGHGYGNGWGYGSGLYGSGLYGGYGGYGHGFGHGFGGYYGTGAAYGHLGRSRVALGTSLAPTFAGC